MATISGSHTRNTSKDYSFFVTYSVTDEPTNLRMKVVATAHFKTGSYVFSHEHSCSMVLKVGGNSKTINWSNYLSCSQKYHDYVLGSITAYYSYGKSNTAVTISAQTTDLTADGYGPGVCKASGSVTISTGCSTSGVLSATVEGEDSAKLKLSSIKATVAYRRVIYWYYKLSTVSNYTRYASTNIAANTAAGTPSVTISGLIPGKTYNFYAAVYLATSSDAAVTRVIELYKNATTTDAAGSIALTGVNVSGMTATVSGMKSLAAYTRDAKFYYKRSADSSWALASTKSIAASSAAGSPSYVFTGLLPGTKYDVKVELFAGSTLYRTLGPVSCSLPHAGVSVPEVESVTQFPPSAFVAIAWRLSTIFYDSLENTMFSVYIVREGGDKILVGTYTNEDLDEQYATECTYDASEWLLDSETITVYVEATNVDSSKSSVSNEVVVDATRQFYWDEEKIQHEKFGIDADEWNRLKQYVNEAHLMYPDYFDVITSADVDEGNAFTAVLANDAAYGGTIIVEQFGDVLATNAMALQASLHERMREATGL